MAKFYGTVGFAITEETSPGVYEEVIHKKDYYGDVENISRRLQSAQDLNDNITISCEISILADSFANENIYAMRYIEYAGTKWKISNATPKFPRILLSLGGVYTYDEN